MIFDSFGFDGSARRRVGYALVASILVHLLIFWPAAVRVLTKDAPARLQATLRALPSLSADPAPPKPAVSRQPTPPAVPPAPTFAQPLAQTVARTVAEAPQQTNQYLEPSRSPLVPPAAAVTDGPVLNPASALGVTPDAVAKAPVAAAGPASGGVLTESSATGELAEGLRGYRLAVATQARCFKRYPAQAEASGWVGSADIRVEVGSDGEPSPATLARSSGYQVLDRAALATINAGALRARLPDSLRGKAFAVVLLVEFSPADESSAHRVAGGRC